MMAEKRSELVLPVNLVVTVRGQRYSRDGGLEGSVVSLLLQGRLFLSRKPAG